MPQSAKAPCVAVVGPANAGKTTVLHQLDERLKRLSDSILVLKGTPDGTGRYQYHSPELRNDPAFKKLVKGYWAATTPDQILEWIEEGRTNLALVLLDFGGRHDEQTAAKNEQLLRACSHYLVVARETDTAGAATWDALCRSLGLQCVGSMKSLALDGSPPQATVSGGEVRGTFQVDVRPGDPRNDLALEPLAARLNELARIPAGVPYINLHQPGDWSEADIADVGGRAEAIADRVTRTGVVEFGGAAPIWAYLAALRRALETRPDARVFIFDPRQPRPLVEIPPAPNPAAASAFPSGALRLSWDRQPGQHVLKLEIVTEDRFLPASAALNLAAAPAPEPLQSHTVALSGAGPVWLHATYARWLIAAGASRLAVWDGRTKRYIPVWT